MNNNLSRPSRKRSIALFPTGFLVGLAVSFLAAALAPAEQRRLRQKAGNLPGEGNVAMMAV